MVSSEVGGGSLFVYLFVCLFLWLFVCLLITGCLIITGCDGQQWSWRWPTAGAEPSNQPFCGRHAPHYLSDHTTLLVWPHNTTLPHYMDHITLLAFATTLSLLWYTIGDHNKILCHINGIHNILPHFWGPNYWNTLLTLNTRNAHNLPTLPTRNTFPHYWQLTYSARS